MFNVTVQSRNNVYIVISVNKIMLNLKFFNEIQIFFFKNSKMV